MYFNNAAKQFNENFRLFGFDSKTQTEKHNFYAGLQNLAESKEWEQSTWRFVQKPYISCDNYYSALRNYINQ